MAVGDNSVNAANNLALDQLHTQQMLNEAATKNYDNQEKFNKDLAAEEKKQASKANEVDRFQAQRSLQNAAQGVYGAMNQTMNGSGSLAMTSMLNDRQDSDNVTYWNQLQKNYDDIANSLATSQQQLNYARNDQASDNYAKTRDILGSLMAARYNAGDWTESADSMYKWYQDNYGKYNVAPVGDYNSYVNVNTKGVPKTSGYKAPASTSTADVINPGKKQVAQAAEPNTGSSYYDDMLARKQANR